MPVLNDKTDFLFPAPVIPGIEIRECLREKHSENRVNCTLCALVYSDGR